MIAWVRNGAARTRLDIEDGWHPAFGIVISFSLGAFNL